MGLFFKAIFIFTIFVGGMGVSGASYAEEYHPLHLQRPDVDDYKLFETTEIDIKTAEGQVYHLNVELAETRAQQARGLMFRTEIAENSGMLFAFDDEVIHTFWMKNTLIPLDMIFVRHDGKIHHIHQNAQPQDLTPITSKYPSLAVLELEGGMADKLGIKVGDVIFHETFGNGSLE
ncbi:MAG: DUF192 domain-containing protein [Micavibrio sp.]|nr:DUF192 domain-containing protein [Micavibrio sp.]